MGHCSMHSDPLCAIFEVSRSRPIWTDSSVFRGNAGSVVGFGRGSTKKGFTLLGMGVGTISLG